MTINLFANVLNNAAIDNLTDAEAAAVLSVFNRPRVEPIEPAAVERAKSAALAIIAESGQLS